MYKCFDINYGSFWFVSEQNGNDKRLSDWNCWPKLVTMPHSKDSMAGHLILGHGRILDKAHRGHHHQQLTCITDRQLQLPPFRNLYHIDCIRAYRPEWVRWAECLDPVHRSRIFLLPAHYRRSVTTITITTAPVLTKPQHDARLARR